MSSHNGTQYFPNASHTTFNNPIITHVSGNAHFSSPERQGLKILLDNISQGAFHDAAERGDPPKCHTHTRVAIRAEIMEWVKAPQARRKLITWMYGPAGAGKTAIGQSIAEECKEKGLLAASFFFSRTASGRNDSAKWVATIAYQILLFLPDIEDHLLTAIEKDRTIFLKTLATQMQVLIIGPLKALPPSLRPVFVVLDGVDEIGPSRQSQTDLVNAIGTATSELQHIPLIFLVASRPEYEIREAFNKPLLSSLTRSLALDDTYRPDEDIKVYFDSTFQKIYDKHVRLGTNLPSPWPSNRDVDLLVSKASGQFIFAATVTKFIDSVRHHPPDRLRIILGLLAPGNETPFALLDALYHHILSSVADLPKVLEILTVLVLPHPVLLKTTPKMVEALLGFGVRGTLVDMHSLVLVPPPTDDQSELRIHHASLVDFLTDKSRSHDLYIDPNLGHTALTRCSLEAITNCYLSSVLLFWLCIHCFTHYCKRSPASDDIVDDLACFNIRQYLGDGRRFLNLYTVRWQDFFECAKEQASGRVDVFPQLQDTFDAFILERLSKYPPSLQAYIPTIIALTGPIKFGLADIFTILCYGLLTMRTSEPWEVRQLDSNLLDIYALLLKQNYDSIDDSFLTLFQDYARAGQYYVDDGSYLALAKQIVGIIYQEPGDTFSRIYEDKRMEVYLPNGKRLDFEWFPAMLSRARKDLTLARILREHALQLDVKFKRGRDWSTAKASLQYIQASTICNRCGISYLKHTHPKGENWWCVVCSEYGDHGAVVIEKVDLETEPEHSPALSSTMMSRLGRFGTFLKHGKSF